MIFTPKTSILALALAGAASMAAAGGPTLNLDGMQIRPKATLELAPGVADALRTTCVDLAVFARQVPLGSSRVRIVYGVQNVSGADYVSGANQQSVAISRPGGPSYNHAFGSLAAGQSRSWSLVVQKPFEIPHAYSVRYLAAPDLYQDGNTRNDDCNRANNRRDVIVG